MRLCGNLYGVYLRKRLRRYLRIALRWMVNGFMAQSPKKAVYLSLADALLFN
jgi:hypothetical protein